VGSPQLTAAAESFPPHFPLQQPKFFFSSSASGRHSYKINKKHPNFPDSFFPFWPVPKNYSMVSLSPKQLITFWFLSTTFPCDATYLRTQSGKVKKAKAIKFSIVSFALYAIVSSGILFLF